MSSKVKINSIEVCAVCLLTDVPMVKITATERSLYLKISGLQVKESKIMPHHFCQTCYSFLEQSKEFRKKCQIAHQIINKIHLSNGQLSKDAMKLLDRKALGLEPPDIPIKKIEIEVDFDQTDEKKPILNSNTNEFSAIVKIEHEDEDKGSVFVLNEPVAKDDDDSDDDGFNIDDSMDAGDNETPEPSSKVPPADSKRKSTTGLKVADKFDIKCMSHADLDIQIATKSVAAEYVDKQFKCDLCFTGFKKETSYKYHMHRHEYGVFGIYQCDICKKFEKSKVMIYRHIRKYHYFKYTCHICKKIAYSTSSALFHYVKKHGKVSYTCRFCSKKFKTIHTLSTHTKYSHSSVPCDICGDCFVSEKGQTYHKKYKHRVKDTPKVEVNEEDPLYCKVCNTLFQNDDALYNHLRKSSKHTAEDARGLAKNSKLFKKRVFNEPRAMQCHVCSQEFPNFNQAIKHYKSLHPDTELPRQHMCDLCGKSFTFLASLLTHRNTHTKDEVYKCSDCSKTFSSYTSRARHTARLHREKSFECSYCNSKFAYNFELKLHIQTVHMKIPYLPRLKAQKRRNEKRKQKSLLENEDV